ncbi:MAG: transporter ATP-binding protein [Acidimicrobiaceae bacterium]|nr:transporter ATP-binding protein [Acidimicrobiaceae bacterium]
MTGALEQETPVAARVPPGGGGKGPLLELDDIDVVYQRRGRPPVQAVLGASLTLGAGEIVGLVGESGCGKSTLGRAAMGLVPLSRGTVRYGGTPVEPLGRKARPQALRSLQMVFQDPYASLNPRRRVGSQIADAVALGRGDGLKSGEAGPAVAQALERVGLGPEVARRYPHEFSGGQCQRIAIARVLASGPRCLVADEPISALDASAQAQIANLLASVAADAGLGLLFISHDLSVVRKIAERTIVMYLGRIVETGATDSVWSAPSHPYTEALIRAIPKPGAGASLPVELPGDVPDPSRPPSGCRFHPRCPKAFDRCPKEEPEMYEVSPTWRSRCFLAEPGVARPMTGPAR